MTRNDLVIRDLDSIYKSKSLNFIVIDAPKNHRYCTMTLKCHELEV